MSKKAAQDHRYDPFISKNVREHTIQTCSNKHSIYCKNHIIFILNSNKLTLSIITNKTIQLKTTTNLYYTVSTTPFLGLPRFSSPINDVSSEETCCCSTVSTAAAAAAEVDASGSTRGVCGRGTIAIFGLISITEFGVFLINSSGISSERGRGIRGLPSRDRVRPPDESRDLHDGLLLSSFFRLAIGSRFGLTPSRRAVAATASVLCTMPGVVSRRGAAKPGPRLVLNRGRFSRNARLMLRLM